MKRILLIFISSTMLTWAQSGKTVLCHVPGGDLSKAVTIETANPSAHIDIETGLGVPQHRLDKIGACAPPPLDFPRHLRPAL